MSRSRVSTSGFSSCTRRIAWYPVAASPTTSKSRRSAMYALNIERMRSLSSTTSTRRGARSEDDIFVIHGRNQQLPVSSTQEHGAAVGTEHILALHGDACLRECCVRGFDVAAAETQAVTFEHIAEHRC